MFGKEAHATEDYRSLWEGNDSLPDGTREADGLVNAPSEVVPLGRGSQTRAGPSYFPAQNACRAASPIDPESASSRPRRDAPYAAPLRCAATASATTSGTVVKWGRNCAPGGLRCRLTPERLASNPQSTAQRSGGPVRAA
jgi:hypothetical protein